MWKRNITKGLRNEGKEYVTRGKSKTIREARAVKQPCGKKCRLRCSEIISEEQRQVIFDSYWALKTIEKQRMYIANVTKTVEPKYRLLKKDNSKGPRKNNNAFYFEVDNKNVRVCKLFFKNTLDINDRNIRTVFEKKENTAIFDNDQRGRHKNHPTVDAEITDGIKLHIDSIPKVESHYRRAETNRTYIDGSKSLAEIHRDYVAKCKENNKPFGNYSLFYRIFTEQYNISFFKPKNDQCDTCFIYENAGEDEKESLKTSYDNHHLEKNLSREEKDNDKKTEGVAVVVYDLQAVFPLPKGEISVFYYKSKLNVYNLTMFDIQRKTCKCYLWDECNGNRGANEIGSCVLSYIESVNDTDCKDIIFWSDNCAGQNKNKFMIALYLYAVQKYNIDTITHKFLIKGHTQNEGDSAHSVIERQIKRLLRSGPVYVPETLVAAIRMAKKTGEPFCVTELSYNDF